MAKFNLYTYQFRPVNKEETLFEKSPLPVEERMEKKQDIFNAFFDKTSEPYKITAFVKKLKPSVLEFTYNSSMFLYSFAR